MEGIHVSKIKKKKKKMLVRCSLSSPVAAKSVRTSAVPGGCVGRGGPFPNCEPSAPSAAQGSIAPAKGWRLLTSPCCAFLQAPDEHKPSTSAAVSQERSTNSGSV